MKVILLSAMRDAVSYLPRYIEQVAGLYLALLDRGDELSLLIGEGDSTDDTRRMLVGAMRQTGLPGRLIDVTHGGPVYGSIEDAGRFAQLAGVANALWRQIPDDAGVVVFVDSDLIWEPGTLVTLIDRLAEYGAASPLIVYEPNGNGPGRQYYDVWGFRKGGVRFVAEPPYHSAVNGQPVELDSAGGCVAMLGEAARRVWFPADDVAVGMTRMLAEHGHPVWLQPDLEVWHPHV
jgi:GT2 family glycosyltransferase